MAENDHYFMEWKEQFVSQERGNRVVNYYLKDSNGESILAIVGTERSVRHMFYVVAEEFVRVHGAENSIHSGFKWRSRREVVDWLTSMLSKEHLQGEALKSQNDMALEFPENAMHVVNVQSTQSRLSRNVCSRNYDIVWSGMAWRCGKKLKHYPVFSRNGIDIAVQSFVFVMAKEENHYIAYLEDMYEDKKGQKKVKVRWFHRNKEVKAVVPIRNPRPKEVFITPYAQVISAECIDGPAVVLTQEHYEKCLAIFPESLLAKVHHCSKQFKGNKVKPFNVSKLRGYFEQPILSCLNSRAFQEPDSPNHSLTDEEEDGLSLEENVKKLGAKRNRCDKGRKTNLKNHSSCEMMNVEPAYKKLKYGSTGKGLLTLKHVEYRKSYNPIFKVDDKIELLCQDSGIRGCWFRCTILHVSTKQMKVRYEDLQDEDDCGNLEEWIPTFKFAMTDKLGMRSTQRPTIRPTSPNENVNLVIEIGDPVDAWWSDGWWEGVVTGANNSDDHNLQVYFPGENLFMTIHKKDVRISRDWVGDCWIDVKKNPDILAAMESANIEVKKSISSTTEKDIKVNLLDTPPCAEVSIDIKPETAEGEQKSDLSIIPSFASLPKNNDIDKSRLLEGESKVGDDDDIINVSVDNVDDVKIEGNGVELS